MEQDHRAADAASSLALEPTDALEKQITELAAHIHAATYRLLVLIAELDRREHWMHDGVLSTAHWLNWKCGIGLVAAREKVRVANALLVKALDAAGEAQYREAKGDDSAESPAHADIQSLNRAAGLDIDDETFTSRWDGTQMDYNMAIGALLADDAGSGL